ncbi:23S rRNA (guanosine(2251)-2'-O)-methyltransferase RlmB [Roseinatronobacter sp.]
MKKPDWVIDKEKARRAAKHETLWLFGLHAVRDALMNPMRDKLRLVVTLNAAQKLEDAIAASGMTAETSDARKFAAPIAADSVHQGAALEVRPLDWGNTAARCAPVDGAGLVVLLDRVSDPHNVGAILRSAEVFGARAVIATQRHAAPETGALAKTASGALERQPYLRVRNLAEEMESLKDMGYVIIGLDGDGPQTLGQTLASVPRGPIGLVLGAEGPGLRDKTRDTCDYIARIPSSADFGSLNVSNAAAVALYEAHLAQPDTAE